MQLLFSSASGNKFIKAMRMFPELWVLRGGDELINFRKDIRKLGGKWSKPLEGFTVAGAYKANVESLLNGVGVWTMETDPTPEQTIKRVGKGYGSTDLNDYILISVDNAVYSSVLYPHKSMSITGTLPDKNNDGSYTYYDGLITVIPQDPTPTPDAKAEEIKSIRSQIKLSPESTSTTKKISLLFKLKQLELSSWDN